LLNIGWFSTGRDEAARQLLQAVEDKSYSGDINGKIGFVFSNRELGESKESDLFFKLVRSYNIPLICLSHQKFKTAGEEKEWRIKYDREVHKKIEPFAPDLCVLAGYMLIVSEELCQKYDMINLHPAPPGGPTGSWQEVIWAFIQNKAETAGAMMHLVTPELDRGPVISYCLFSIKGEPFSEYWRRDDKKMLFRLIRQHELVREFPLITLTLQALSRGDVGIKDGTVIDARGKTISGYNLSGKVDEEVKKN
jgi:folate-dependent phosphoribosylglycinamide formyltransferase PurN